MIINRKANIRKRNTENHSRLNFIVAIIFLSACVLIGRLFNLQVLNYDLYTALASDQHLVFSELEPNRGRIYYQDNQAGEEEKLYPVATNKEFALVYAVPSMIEKPEEVAEKIYEVFEKEAIEKEVDELLANDEFFKQTPEQMSAEEWKMREEYKKTKREAEIEIRKKVIFDAYLAKLSKKNDPYEPLQKKVDEVKLKQLTDLNLVGIKYVMQKHRYYPEGNAGSQLLGFVGNSGEKEAGSYGLEGFFNDELSGKQGSVRTERSADGRTIIVNDREYDQPNDGSDLVLTINRSIQYVVCNKLYQYVLQHGADSGSVIVMEPKTGAIIAMCSAPDFDPNNYGNVENDNLYNNPAIFAEFEPGSTFKAITIASGIDKGVIEPSSLYTDKGQIMIEGWPKPISNSDFSTHGAWGTVDMAKVLEQS
ncbi:MAG: penicillin-binding transpeptidase domain-containing protein, partial [Candidatus Magasanikbacteria bacterium]|nr:penicillin-binding transpeptidase domain-containing protein [Candidatus Magasanikbacteria bacterium]